MQLEGILPLLMSRPGATVALRFNAAGQLEVGVLSIEPAVEDWFDLTERATDKRLAELFAALKADTSIPSEDEIESMIQENISKGFMEEVPDKPGHYRLTPAGEARGRELVAEAGGDPSNIDQPTDHSR